MLLPDSTTTFMMTRLPGKQCWGSPVPVGRRPLADCPCCRMHALFPGLILLSNCWLCSHRWRNCTQGGRGYTIKVLCSAGREWGFIPSSATCFQRSVSKLVCSQTWTLIPFHSFLWQLGSDPSKTLCLLTCCRQGRKGEEIPMLQPWVHEGEPFGRWQHIYKWLHPVQLP